MNRYFLLTVVLGLLIPRLLMADSCPSLSVGSSGNSVLAVQKVLKATYPNFPKPTGYFGLVTQAAVKQWQKEHGIEAVGTVGPKTAASMKLCADRVSAFNTSNVAGNNQSIQILLAQLKVLQDKLAALSTTAPSPTPAIETPNLSNEASPVPPSAVLSTSPNTGATPLMTNLLVSTKGGTTCRGGMYVIDWGDGSTALTFTVAQSECGGVEKGFSHVYVVGGNFTITLRFEGQKVTTQVSSVGSGITPYIGSWSNTFKPNIFQNSYAIESSLIWFAGSMRLYYQCNSNSVCARPLTDVEMTQPLSPGDQIVPGKCRFPFVFDGQNGTLYLACGLTDDLGDVYLYQSQDGLRTWRIANGGNPIIHQTSTLTGISNIAVLPVNGTWHMLVEAAYGIWQSSAPAIGITGTVDFNKNLSKAPVIVGGGNPDLKLSYDGRSLVAVHGIFRDMTRFGGSWYVTVSTASLSNPDIWTTYNNTYAVGETGVDIADPTVVAGPEGAWVMTSYAQSHLRLMNVGNNFQRFVNALVMPVTLNVPPPPPLAE